VYASAVSHRADQPPAGRAERTLVDWPTSIGLAIGGTAAAIALILVFTFLVEWVGEFWAQVVYFAAVFGAILFLALRDRRKDALDPERRRRGAQITPAGLPGPFVFTQAVGVLGLAMLAIGAGLAWVDDDPRGLVWVGGGIVLTLLGGVGLAFWLSGLRRRSTHGR
jgi:MFS family permease